MANKKKPFDFWIFITVMILLSMGIIMVFSASVAYSYVNLGDTYYFLRKQLIYAAAGIIAMIIAIKVDYKKLGKLSFIILIISIVLLGLVLIPGIGQEIKGSKRWFDLKIMSFQPSELAKFAIILFFSYSLSKRKEKIQSFLYGLIPYLGIIGVFAGLLMLEPHMSGTIVIGMVGCIILFSAGAKIKHFILLAAPALTGIMVLIFTSEYRMKRFLTFLDPWKDLQGDGWQIVNSLYAIGSGGLFGRGLGKSLQKFLYIPEPQNDFIFAIIAEELGLIGVLAVLSLFLVFIWRGIKISMSAPDAFGSLLAVGITSLVAVQVIINVAVVSGSMPVTGMPLPFFSSGGSSLVILMAQVGVLLNISKQANYERI